MKKPKEREVRVGGRWSTGELKQHLMLHGSVEEVGERGREMLWLPGVSLGEGEVVDRRGK